MFSQFTQGMTGPQIYLLFSLGIFVVFFVIVTVFLILLKKQYVNYMSDLPLDDSTLNPNQPLTL